MKTLSVQKWFVAVGVAAFLAATAMAQNNAQTPDISVVNSTAPALASSVAQVLELSQAKISDGTIISFIQNSQTTYPLAASQIVYLKQQGVSDLVLNAMLNQHPAMAASAQAAPPPAVASSASAEIPSATVPATTYVQSAPSSVYVIPDTQTYYYDYGYYGYPYYYYPPVGVSIGLGWGWYGGYGGWHGGYGGWHGGYGGGFRGGGGFHR